MRKGILKKIAALGLAVATTLSMGVTALAADNVAVNGPRNGHTYEVYQVFTGDVDAKNNFANARYGTVAKLPEGKKVDEAVVNTTLEALQDVASSTDDRAKLDKILEYVDQTKLVTEYATATVDDTNATANVAPGYYLIKDKDRSIPTNDKKADAYTLYLVKIVGSAITIEPKSEVPTVEKEVKEDSKNAWQKYADAEIGQLVDFKLTGSLPEDYANYKYYKYVFEDSFTNMAFKAGSVKVALGKSGKDITDLFTVNANNETGKLTVSCNNLKANVLTKDLATDDTIVVTYQAALTSAAVVGNPGNPNKVDLVYSNNPNVDANGDKDTTDKTPEKEVLVFTYELDTTKYDANTNEELDGAKFVLKNSHGKFAILNNEGKLTGWADTEGGATVLVSQKDVPMKVVGLDSTDVYTLVEKVAPKGGYRKLDKDITITITSEIETSFKKIAEITAINAKVGAPAKLIAGETDYNKGKVAIDVPNTKESNLPTTGGMGTRLFYIIGGVLMAGAAIALVAKKKMNRV